MNENQTILRSSLAWTEIIVMISRFHIRLITFLRNWFNFHAAALLHLLPLVRECPRKKIEYSWVIKHLVFLILDMWWGELCKNCLSRTACIITCYFHLTYNLHVNFNGVKTLKFPIKKLCFIESQVLQSTSSTLFRTVAFQSCQNSMPSTANKELFFWLNILALG